MSGATQNIQQRTGVMTELEKAIKEYDESLKYLADALTNLFDTTEQVFSLLEARGKQLKKINERIAENE